MRPPRGSNLPDKVKEAAVAGVVSHTLAGGGTLRLVLSSARPLNALIAAGSAQLAEAHWYWQQAMRAAGSSATWLPLLKYRTKIFRDMLKAQKAEPALLDAALDQLDNELVNVVVRRIRYRHVRAPTTRMTRLWELANSKDLPNRSALRGALWEFELAISRYEPDIATLEYAAGQLKKELLATNAAEAKALGDGIETVVRTVRRAAPTEGGQRVMESLRKLLWQLSDEDPLRSVIDGAYDALATDTDRWLRFGNLIDGLPDLRKANPDEFLAALRRGKGALGEALALSSPAYRAEVARAETEARRVIATLRRMPEIGEHTFSIVRPKFGVRALTTGKKGKPKKGVQLFYDDCVLVVDQTTGIAYPVLATQVKGGETGLQGVVEQILKDQVRETLGVIELVGEIVGMHGLRQLELRLPPPPHELRRVIIGPEIPEASGRLLILASGTEVVLQPALLDGDQLEQLVTMALQAAGKL
jgi:hypothetical protein